MREMYAEIAGKERRLVASFGAANTLASKVADPMLIAREAAMESVMLAQGMTSYVPKWRFTVKNVPEIIYIGLREAKEDVTLDQVNEWAFDIGFREATGVAAQYLALINGPRPTVELDEDKDAKAGE